MPDITNEESLKMMAEEKPQGAFKEFYRRFKKNKLAMVALIVLIFIHLLIFVGPLFYTVSPEALSPREALQPPSAAHPLGLDESGRDSLARLLYGGRISLLVALFSMLIVVGMGTLAGALAGYFGGAIDMILMRLTDALMSIPSLFLLLIIFTIFRGGVVTIIIVLGLTSWMGISRIVRGEVLRWKAEDFVEAEHALGAKSFWVIFRHILPNAAPSIIVAASLDIAKAILQETSLSYLGLGIQPPTPSLGNMLMNAQTYVWNAPLQAVWPGLMILIIVICFNTLGDGLRVALDPRMKH